MDQRFIFGMFVIASVVLLQGLAWYLNINGGVWAFTSLIVGLTAGSLLGFSFSGSGTRKNQVEQKGK